MIGQTVSHYRILEKLGEGGMGVVYRAEDLMLRRTVALKFLGGQVIGHSAGRARFLHEAQAAAMIDHPNVCAVYGFEEAGGHVFIVMEFVEGAPLSRRLREGRMPLRVSLSTAIQIGEGLRAAHDKGIVHRDVKPGNILIGTDGMARLTDFGLALLAEGTRITTPGTLVGTVAYMSPEQALTKAVDRRSDIWSLGAVLYEMITGTPPFRERDAQALLLKITQDPMPAFRGSAESAPPFLRTAVGKALAKQPEERYQYIDDFIVDLRGVLRELPQADEATTEVGAFVQTIDQSMVETRTQVALDRATGIRPSRLSAALQNLYGRLRGRSSAE
jgi:eukaryotic-like serine/threonine-protein kinase